MATTCDIARLNTDGTIRVIHVSGDGYLAGVGVTLVRFYNTPEAVETLFSGGTHPEAVSFTRPEELEWMEGEEWYPPSFTREEFMAEFGSYDTEGEQPNMEDYDDPPFAGMYFYAHGKWIYPFQARDVLTFIDTGESPFVLTREFIDKDGYRYLGVDPWTYEPETR